MITNLNEPIKASKGFEKFEKLPDGKYIVEVDEFKEWKKVDVKNAKLKARDENGKVIKGQFETVANLSFYKADVVYKVIEGEHEGRKIFGSLSTHPDQAWTISRFVYALGLEETTPADLSMLAVGNTLAIDVKFVDDTYEKVETDKETGIEQTVTKNVTRTYINEYIKL